jgi:hypothetical protein
LDTGVGQEPDSGTVGERFSGLGFRGLPLKTFATAV